MVKVGYRQTEIGVIPEDWSVKNVYEIAEIKTGGRNTQDRVENGIYPFFVRSQIVERINSYSFDGEAVLTAGDGVGVGKVFHYINGKFDYHQRVYAITNFQSIVNGYYFFKYFQNNFLERISQMTAKSSVDSVRMDTIAEMKIPIPPLAEQEIIAKVLSDTDTWIACLEKSIAKSQSIRHCALQDLFTKPVSNGVPGDWEIKKIGELGFFFPTNSLSRDNLNYHEGQVYNIHYGDIHTQFKTHFNIDNENVPFVNPDMSPAKFLSHCIEGDLVIADASENEEDIGKAIEISCIGDKQIVCGLHTIHFRPLPGVFFKSYLGYVWQTSYLKRQILKESQGTKVLGISTARLKDVIIPIPPLSEQIRIANILSDMDTEIESLEAQLEKAQQIKQGMMQDLLTGRVRLV